MNDREKLIELIGEAYSKCLKTHCEKCVFLGQETALTDRNCQYRLIADHLLANGVTVQRWIPVTERLPEKNTAVIAVTDNGIVFQCLYGYDGWDLWEGNEVHITHWMPLPEPPKEDDYGIR